MLFYLMRTEMGELTISPNVQTEEFSSKGEMLTPGLPLLFAQSLIKALDVLQTRDAKKKILKHLRKFPGLQSMDWRWLSLPLETENPVQSKAGKIEDFTSRIQGRQLSEADLQRLANEMGLSLMDVIQLCQETVRQGQAEWISAVQKERQGCPCRLQCWRIGIQ